MKKRLARSFSGSVMEADASIRQNITAWLVGFGTGTWSNFGPMFAELFPTRLRTTAVGSVFNAARGAQFVAPLVVAAMARRYGLGGGIALAAGFALAAAGWVWLLPETRGQRMEA